MTDHITPDQVWQRAIEAQKAFRRLRLATLPKGYGSAWPAIVRDLGDAIGAESQRQIEGIERGLRALTEITDPQGRVVRYEAGTGAPVTGRVPFPADWYRPDPPSASDLSRALEFTGWVMRYLPVRQDADELRRERQRMALTWLSYAKAHGLSARRLVKRMGGLSIRMYYRFKAEACETIARELNRAREAA